MHIMEYTERLKEFGPGSGAEWVADVVRRAGESAYARQTREIYAACFACLDLTTLDVRDTARSVGEFTRRAMEMGRRKGVPPVASVCVYPNFVEAAGLAAGDSGLRITSVAGGFPSSQTYLEVKMLEAAMAVENGADEIDMVMGAGLVAEGNYEEAASEIETIRQEVGEDVTLKVIIEAGELPSAADVRTASLLAMMAGADFVKTSTGKTPVGTTPESAAIICAAIGDFHAATGRKVGFKAAGGIRTVEDAALYYAIVDSILGSEWLNPSLFRIGASSLADELLARL